uniref:Uncharacterized protein n=1 Tax=Anguilla anguilla TaxID=7936 RepID=A0A0E9TVL8_ANGAN
MFSRLSPQIPNPTIFYTLHTSNIKDKSRKRKSIILFLTCRTAQL